jgi:hypothetical protein
MSPSPEKETPLSPDQIERYTRATLSLREQAAKHANFGRFNLSERPDGHYQNFQDVYFPPVGVSLEVVADTCRGIMGEMGGVSNFDRLLEAFNRNPDAVAEAKKIYLNGGRVLLVTPHRELVDVAMAMAGAQVSMGEPELVYGTRIFVGPIIKELEIMGIPAVEALQYSSGVIVAVPDTASTQEQIISGSIDPSVKSDANTAVKEEFESQIIRDEVDLVATAPSGSTDEETESHILMKPVSVGTNVLARRYFSGEENGIWPIALVMKDNQVAFEVGDIIHLKHKESLHDVMAKFLAPMYTRISGKLAEYQQPEPRLPKASLKTMGRIAKNS